MNTGKKKKRKKKWPDCVWFMACWYYGTPCAKRNSAFEKEESMWETKTFKTRELFQNWIDRNSHKYQWHELFVQNGYGVEFKKLRLVY